MTKLLIKDKNDEILFFDEIIDSLSKDETFTVLAVDPDINTYNQLLTSAYKTIKDLKLRIEVLENQSIQQTLENVNAQ